MKRTVVNARTLPRLERIKTRIEYEVDTAEPRVRVEVAGRVLQVRAEELSCDEAAAFWPRVIQAAPDYARYQRRTSRRIPLIRLVPVN